MRGTCKSVVLACLFLIYPFLVYQGAKNGLTWLAPAVFSAIHLKKALAARRARVRIYNLLIAVTFLLGSFYLQTLSAKLMPVLIQLMLMYVFGRTLRNFNGPPFIERFVRLEYPEFPPGVADYCRQLTILWTGFFAFNALMGSALALWGSDLWWALYNGAIIYILIAALMIGEYVYRPFRFPDLFIPDPKSTIKTMITNGPKVWLDTNRAE
ncbi:MAG: hypothetical protein ACU843_02020 [Gammaproteobacteria bacterium]